MPRRIVNWVPMALTAAASAISILVGFAVLGSSSCTPWVTKAEAQEAKDENSGEHRELREMIHDNQIRVLKNQAEMLNRLPK